MNQIFSISRLLPFLKYKLVLNYKTWLIQLGAFIGIFTAISALFFIELSSVEFGDYYIAMQILTLFPCGFYITSRSYHELSSTGNGFLFMQLPVSTFEKFVVPALFSGIVFPIMFMLFFSGVGSLSNAFLSIFYHYTPFQVPVFTDVNLQVFKAYVTIQPFFLIGSIKFKKQHLLWTAISMVSIVLVFLLFWIPISKLAYGSDNYTIINFTINDSGFSVSDLVLLAIMLIGWTISYFTLKEREV